LSDFDRVQSNLNLLKEIVEETQLLLDTLVTSHDYGARDSNLTSNILVHLMDGLAKEIVIKIRRQKELKYQEHQEFKFRKISGWPEGIKLMVKVYHDKEYLTTFFLTRPYKMPQKFQRLEIILTARELYTLLNQYSKKQGSKNPYKNPMSVGCRCAKNKKAMEQAGWEYVQGDNPDKLTYKRKGGYDHWRFSKVINAIEE
jgi:hypothetical protein